jgi:hypothetical protein
MAELRKRILIKTSTAIAQVIYRGGKEIFV